MPAPSVSQCQASVVPSQRLCLASYSQCGSPMPSMKSGWPGTSSSNAKKSNSWTSPAVEWPSRFENRSIVFVLWTTSSGPTATHGSGGSNVDVAWLMPSNAPNDVAAGAPETVAWTEAGGVAVIAGARRPRVLSDVPRFALFVARCCSGFDRFSPAFALNGWRPSPWTVG